MTYANGFSKIFLEKILYFQMDFFFFFFCTEGRFPYLWSLSAWDSWRTPWPQIALEDRAVADKRRHRVELPGSPGPHSTLLSLPSGLQNQTFRAHQRLILLLCCFSAQGHWFGSCHRNSNEDRDKITQRFIKVMYKSEL